MQRASSETIVLDAERSFEPAISRPQLSALTAELWSPRFIYSLGDPFLINTLLYKFFFTFVADRCIKLSVKDRERGRGEA